MMSNNTQQQNSIARESKDANEDAAPLHDLTSFQRDLLREIAANEEPYGLGLKRALQAAYGEEVHHGRLYMALDQLVDRGLVEKGKIDERTNSYALTEKGERAFGAHLRWMCSTGGED